MSTRGWYEIYVLDEESSRFELSMQFYKWGDAVPDNAIHEYEQIEALMLDTLEGVAPVFHVESLLKESIGDATRHLPRSFPLGYFLFLLLRAEHELRSPWQFVRWLQLPKEERPDYTLGFKVGLESVRQGVECLSHPDPIIDRALFSIDVGRLARRWQDCDDRFTFLRWLQFITMLSEDHEMGHIAGSYSTVWDISYLYRIFVYVPRRTEHTQNVERITLQICLPRGEDLRNAPWPKSEDTSHDEEQVWLDSVRTRDLERITSLGERYQSLDDIRRQFDLETSTFWNGHVPRGSYIGP